MVRGLILIEMMLEGIYVLHMIRRVAPENKEILLNGVRVIEVSRFSLSSERLRQPLPFIREVLARVPQSRGSRKIQLSQRRSRQISLSWSSIDSPEFEVLFLCGGD